MKYLDAWLDDPQAPPYLLLAVPAGRGKSALLVRWRQRVLTRKEIAVVFVPVSIRYGTNLESVVFTALTARLAMLHGDKPPDPNASTPTLRGMMMDYLSRPLPDGRRLLVILDGVDEAADWEAGPYLFPASPLKNLRVIVSARYLAGDVDSASWLRRLGWKRRGLARAPFLDRLSRDGVADVLRQMGVPLISLGERVDIVHELHRLSEGDPLVLRLYVDDLWRKGEEASRLQPEDLQKVLEPGLEGYFEDWWKYQRNLWDTQSERKGGSTPLCDPPVCELLTIFACACGPLSRNDLLRLISKEVKMDTWMFEKSLKSLERIIIGDGVRQGYAFSHPRLGSYFYKKLVDSDRENFESRFLDYGKDTLEALNKGASKPNEASRYIVQYYGMHLEQSHSIPENVLSLVSEGWLQAWEAQEGAYTGFLNDVNKAWNAAERSDLKEIQEGRKAKYLGKTILCALCFASANSLSANIPITLLVLLVKNKIWNPTQGLAYARQNPTLRDRARALWELSLEFEEPQRTDILEETLSAARKIEYERDRAVTLAEIASKLPDSQKTGILEEALSTAREIKDEWQRAMALTEIAPMLLDPQKTSILEEALSAAREKKKNEWQRATELAQIASMLLDPQKTSILEEALSAAREKKNEWQKATELAQIASMLPNSQKTDILEEALSAAGKIKDEWQRSMALAQIAPKLPDSQKTDILEEALSAAGKIKDKWQRSMVLAQIAPTIPDPTKALSVAREIKDEWSRAMALADIAPTIPDPTKALSIAREIKDERQRAMTLVDIAPKLPDSQKTDILEEALSEARMIRDEEERAIALAEFAPKLPDSQKTRILEEALSVARRIWDEEEKAITLAEIASNLPDPTKSLSVAREIKDGWGRAVTLAEIASKLPDSQKTDILEEALSVARELENKRERVMALADIAPTLPDSQKTGILEEALFAAREIKSELDRAMALAKIAPNLSDPQKTDILEEALSAATKTKSEWERATALAKIAPKFSDPTKALSVASEIKNEGERAMALAEIAPNLSDPQKTDILEEALSLSTEASYNYLMNDCLTEIAPLLAEQSPPRLYSLWCKTLRILAQRTRSDLLSSIVALSPVIAALSSPESIEDTVQAILDVAQWWP